MIYFGYDGHIAAGMGLARVLYLQGYTTDAAEHARRMLKDATELDHPVTLSMALVWAIHVFLETDDLSRAEDHIDWFISRAVSHSLGPYLAVGHGFRGQLAIRRDDVESGVDSLQTSLRELHAARYELLTTPFNTSLAKGLAALGRTNEAITLIDETIQHVETNVELCYLPELLRLKGVLLLSTAEPLSDAADACLRRAFDMSRQQGARTCELRTAVDLAAMLVGQGHLESARASLRPVLDQFPDGSDTNDLRAARRLLATLG
jgi:tetratricopeptide (TPR) repeat protein